MFAAMAYDPIVQIELGPLNISPHGVGIAVGFLLGARLMLPAAERRGISADTVYTLLTRAAIGAIVGARLAWVINHLGELESPLDVFAVWEGGISLLGGFVGAIVAAVPAMRKERLSFWTVMDAAAPGMALGVIVGRIGDMIVADHLGKVTSDFPLAYECPPVGVDTASTCLAGPGGFVHQPHLYDLVLTTVLLFLLLRLRRTPRYDGFLILVFGAVYGFNRFVEDWFRIDETHGFGLTGSQWTAVAATLLCSYVLLVRRTTPAWGRWDTGSPAPDATEPTGAADADPPPDAVEPESSPPGPSMTIPPQDREE